MPNQYPIPPLNFVSTVDLSTKMNCAVDKDAVGGVNLPGAGGRAIGILVNAPYAGKAAAVQILGEGEIYVGAGGVTDGDNVKVDTNGHIVTASPTDVTNGLRFGIATRTNIEGDLGQVFLSNAVSLAVAAASLIETKTSGALTSTVGKSYLSITGTQAFSQADGTYIGQKKVIECAVAATTPVGTLTIATGFGSVANVTHVFSAVGQRLELEWTATGWLSTGGHRAGSETAVCGTTVLTGHDMTALLLMSVTGTVDSTGTKGLPNGKFPGDRVVVGNSVAASTPVGSLDGTYITTAGAAATHLQAIGATTDTVTLEWTGTAWLVEANSGITVA